MLKKFISHKKNKILFKRTAFWAVLLFVSLRAEANYLEILSDTLIIDGITIGVEIETNPEDSLLTQELDSVPEAKLKKERKVNLGLSYSYGLGRAGVLNETMREPVDLFIGNENVPLSFSSLNLFTEVVRMEKLSVQVGVSYASWNQTISQIDSEVRDSTWAFSSPSDGSLFQITRIITPLGVEYDTLEMKLSEENWKQSCIEMPITLLERLTPVKNKLGIAIGLSIIPAYCFSTYEGTTYTLGINDIELFEASKPSVQRFNISGQVEGRVNRKLSDHLNAYLNVGFRNNFTGLFSSPSPVELSRGAGFASLGLHYFF